MDKSTKYYEFLEEILQPRGDYFDIETIKPLLVQTIEQLIDIDDHCWNLRCRPAPPHWVRHRVTVSHRPRPEQCTGRSGVADEKDSTQYHG